MRLIPALFIPLIYFWQTTLGPALNWLAFLWVSRRSQRIAAFLKLAADLGMRKHPPDGLLPRRTGGEGVSGEGGISG